MKRISLLLAFCLSPLVINAATITYTYDAQHRLVQASYSASQKEFFNHDAAGNVDQRVAITDAKYLESWLWYFSMLDLLPLPGFAQNPWFIAFRGSGQTVADSRTRAM